jgi:hypothetical protein
VVAASLSLLTLTGGSEGGAQSGYSLAGMIVFEGIAICVGVLLVLSHLSERIPAQRGVLLGIAAGLGFGVSDVAIKAPVTSVAANLSTILAGLGSSETGSATPPS